MRYWASIIFPSSETVRLSMIMGLAVTQVKVQAMALGRMQALLELH